MKKGIFLLSSVLLVCFLAACGGKEQKMKSSNILIVYFSRWGNTDYPDDIDATTSASIVIDEGIRFGTTEYAAEMIAEETGADTYRIETVTPYTADFDELRNVNHDEMDRNYLPELKGSDLDISLYDTALAEEIKAYFPLTISMSGYGGREYYGGVEFYPENLEGGQKNFENGDITYCEAHHNMAIFYHRPTIRIFR